MRFTAEEKTLLKPGTRVQCRTSTSWKTGVIVDGVIVKDDDGRRQVTRVKFDKRDIMFPADNTILLGSGFIKAL